MNEPDACPRRAPRSSSPQPRARPSSRELRQVRPGATDLLLLHGWVASGGLNWFRAFEPLARALPHRRPRPARPRPAACAPAASSGSPTAPTTAAATLVALDTGPVIAVGYSMGGPVAQLLWRRHRDLVSGLVLCATCARLRADIAAHASRTSRAMLGCGERGPGRGAGARRSRRCPLGPAPAPTAARVDRRRAPAPRLAHDRRGRPVDRARTTPAVGSSEVDVPTTVVCTTERPRGAAGPTARDGRRDSRRDRRIDIAEGHLACAGADVRGAATPTPATTSPTAPSASAASADCPSRLTSAYQRGRFALRPACAAPSRARCRASASGSRQREQDVAEDREADSPSANQSCTNVAPVRQSIGERLEPTA